MGFKSGLYGGRLEGSEKRPVDGFPRTTEPAASLAHGLCSARAFVSGQVVEDDDGSRIKHRGQLRLNVSVEGCPVHCPLYNPRCDQSVLRQPGDKGLCAPFAERGGAVEPLSDRGPSAQPREVRLDRRLVNKDQPVRLLTHAGLAAHDPVTTCLAQRGPVTLCRDQSFFYMTVRRVRERGAARRAAPPRHVSGRGRRPVP